MRISLTQFLNFSSKTSLSKLKEAGSVVKQAESEYSVASDYYGEFRRATVFMHKHGLGIEHLNKALFRAHPSRQENYRECISQYKKWLGGRSPLWIAPPKSIYSAHGVEINVSPELGFFIDGKVVFIKMYINKDPLDLNSMKMVCALMRKVHGDANPGADFAVLDVKRGRIKSFSPQEDAVILEALDLELQYLSGAVSKRVA